MNSRPTNALPGNVLASGASSVKMNVCGIFIIFFFCCPTKNDPTTQLFSVVVEGIDRGVKALPEVGNPGFAVDILPVVVRKGVALRIALLADLRQVQDHGEIAC